MYLDFLVLDQLDWCSLTRLDSCYLEVSFLMDQVIVSRLDELMVSQKMFLTLNQCIKDKTYNIRYKGQDVRGPLRYEEQNVRHTKKKRRIK